MRDTRVSLLAIVAVVTVCSPAQADFGFLHGGHSYLVVEQGRTWDAAAADALTRQVAGTPGHLAIVETAAENTAIFNALLANITVPEFNNTRAPDGGGGAFAWLAANDILVEGNWIWDGDGDHNGPLFYQGLGNAGGGPIGGAYHNWGTFNGANWEPDNGARGFQDAGGIALANYPRGLAGQWNDVLATNLLYYIVEFDAVPEPTTLGLFLLSGGFVSLSTRRRPSAARGSS